MSLLILDHFENAARNLQRNRGRSVLTTIGVAIGVAGVTCILALNDGVSNMISDQIGSLENRLIVIRPGLESDDPNAYSNPLFQPLFATSSLTTNDVDTISRLDGIAISVPIMALTGSVESASHTLYNHPILATTADFTKVSDIKVQRGEFINDSYGEPTAVVGAQLAIDLFDTDSPIGQQFKLRGIMFTVTGVLARIDDPINYNNIDFNNALVMHIERGKQLHDGRSQIQQIDVLTLGSRPLESIKSDVQETLAQTHNNERDYSVLTGEEITRPTNNLYVAIMQVMTAIAAISLIVGGVGIMNILLVGVAERTREIGIRKAVGATNGAIVMQFIIESLIISLLGGALGYLLGYVAAFAISTFLYFAPAFTWMTAGVALAMSVGIGIIFGLYPAFKAARKNTIESLRQYH